MAIFIPINIGFDYDCSLSDVNYISWDESGLHIRFIVPKSKSKLFSVKFESSTIVRMIDEEFISSEQDNGDSIGIVSGNILYRMSGSIFLEMIPELFLVINSPVEHYRFITGGGCLDVACGTPPIGSIIDV